MQYEKRKLLADTFQEFLEKKSKTPTFQKTFCCLLSPHWKNNREAKLKCFPHTALISDAFFDESKDKINRTLWSQYALKERNERFSIY